MLLLLLSMENWETKKKKIWIKMDWQGLSDRHWATREYLQIDSFISLISMGSTAIWINIHHAMTFYFKIICLNRTLISIQFQDKLPFSNITFKQKKFSQLHIFENDRNPLEPSSEPCTFYSIQISSLCINSTLQNTYSIFHRSIQDNHFN